MMGRYYYSSMYKIHPEFSYLIMLMVSLFFTFFVLNMYTAIVARTYNKMRETKFFLTEAMARILFDEIK